MSYFLDQFRDNFSNFEWKFAVLILLIRSLFLRPEYEFCVDRFSSFMQAFKRLNGLICEDTKFLDNLYETFELKLYLGGIGINSIFDTFYEKFYEIIKDPNVIENNVILRRIFEKNYRNLSNYLKNVTFEEQVGFLKTLYKFSDLWKRRIR